jgi:nickel/cobalt exporter
MLGANLRLAAISFRLPMGEALLLLATNFLYGAYHAIQPGHGKTIAAAYIVGARGRPVDAWILGIFVTLSHTSGIVLVGVVASLGLPGLGSHRIEAWLALATGILVMLLGFWTLWTQRQMFEVAGWTSSRLPAMHSRGAEAGAIQYRLHEPGHVHAAGDGHHTHADLHALSHTHSHADGHAHDHSHPGDESAGYHSHGWGMKHTHDVTLVTTNRPSLWILIWLGIAGGLLPDPVALGLLMRALVEGKVMLGLAGVLVFSLGFAAVLVLVGVIAAAAGKRILDWLAGSWAARLQIGTSLMIVLVGVVLTAIAWQKLSQLA